MRTSRGARGCEALAQRYEKRYRDFAAAAPPLYTASLWHERPSWNFWRMLMSSVARASWDHVIFNLFFFFAFAAIVELVIGPVPFLLCFVLLAFGIGSFDSLASPAGATIQAPHAGAVRRRHGHDGARRRLPTAVLGRIADLQRTLAALSGPRR